MPKFRKVEMLDELGRLVTLDLVRIARRAVEGRDLYASPYGELVLVLTFWYGPTRVSVLNPSKTIRALRRDQRRYEREVARG